MIPRRSLALLLLLAPAAACAGGRGAGGGTPGCEAACSVEVENRAATPIEVLIREGLSVRPLGEVSGYASGVFVLPAGIAIRAVEARLAPGAGAAGRRLSCQFHQRAGGHGRLVCDVRDR